ncbi:MAG TPA: serine/threonine-protein kinase, partial [Polyangiaceae bacterium]|nr:serine/threonine-protein kinase [Polyangiaceae bacterium]
MYRIIRLIGQGGMGEVYEVEHDMLGTRRALKGLVKGFAGRTDLAERLRVEARGLARLRHPNLVEVYDLGTALDGRIYFVMELLEGATLRAMLSDQGRLSVSISVELMIQVLAGLQAAHGAGIVHRDVKPENVFVCRDGTVKLLDFGVAKVMDAWIPNQPITVKGMTVGTPQYMSPEQAEGRALDGRTDVYAAALVLWEMLIGRPAYSDTDVYELLQAKWRGVMPLAEMGIGVSRGLSDVIVRASQPDLNERYPSATAFQQALRIALVQSYLSSEAAEPKLRKKRDSLPSLEDMARSNRLMPPDVDATALT